MGQLRAALEAVAFGRLPKTTGRQRPDAYAYARSPRAPSAAPTRSRSSTARSRRRWRRSWRRSGGSCSPRAERGRRLSPGRAPS
jgi:hypothetical protein